MNTAPDTTKAVPTGAPIGGNAARRAAYQSAGQLGRRFGVGAGATFGAPVESKPVIVPTVPLERVLATYNMFNTAA